MKFSFAKSQHFIRLIIYAVLMAAIIILWFILAGKVKSMQKNYISQSEQNAREIYTNYQQKLSQTAKSATELGALGETLINKGFTNLGLLTLEEANKKDGDIRDLALYTATIYFRDNNLAKAKEYALKAEKLDPLYPPTFNLLGDIYTQEGNATDAQLCYNKAKDFGR